MVTCKKKLKINLKLTIRLKICHRKVNDIFKGIKLCQINRGNRLYGVTGKRPLPEKSFFLVGI